MQSWFTINLNGESWRLEGQAVAMSLLTGLKRRGEIDVLAQSDEDQGGALVVILGGDQSRRPVFRAIDSGLAPLVTMSGRKIWTVRGLKEAFPDHPLWDITKRYPALEPHPVRMDNLLVLLFEWCGMAAAQKKSPVFGGFISRTADYAGLQGMIRELGEAQYDLSALIEEKVEELEEVQ
ncbi:MAG: hypothetical protein GXP30_01345, partial [Verrucomicrobia bacterium]|nr:hypothetical protein [Verrucomicrobiota bacterium]